MDFNKQELAMLKKLVKEEIRKAQTTPFPTHGVNGKKPRNKYGLTTLTTLYGLESKLK